MTVFYNRPAGARGPKPYASGAGRANRSSVGDANYTIKSWDKVVALTAALTATRTWSVPPANSVPQGYEFRVIDEVGGISAASTLILSATGLDAFRSGSVVGPTITLTSPGWILSFTSDGATRWTTEWYASGTYASDLTVTGTATFNGNILAANLRDSTTFFYDNLDPSKRVDFQLSGLTAGLTRTATWPDASGTVVLETNTATLTNKTIALGSNTVSGTTAQFNTALTDGDFATLAGTETLTNKTMSGPSLAVTGSMRTSSNATPLGYAAGAGATVTQITSRTTGVTINTPTGQIITDTTAIAAGATETFVVTNSSVLNVDVVAISLSNTPTNAGKCIVQVQNVAAGAFSISVYNAGTVNEIVALQINYAVIKVQTS